MTYKEFLKVCTVIYYDKVGWPSVGIDKEGRYWRLATYEDAYFYMGYDESMENAKVKLSIPEKAVPYRSDRYCARNPIYVVSKPFEYVQW